MGASSRVEAATRIFRPQEQAAAEFTSLRALAPKFTVVIERQLYPGFFTPQFLDRITARSREYGIPEK